MLPPQDLHFATQDVIDMSLKSMGGSAETPAEMQVDDSGPVAGSAADVAENTVFLRHVKKRKLYRQVTGHEVAWLP